MNPPTLWASEKDWNRVLRRMNRMVRRQERWLRRRTRGPVITMTWEQWDSLLTCTNTKT